MKFTLSYYLLKYPYTLWWKTLRLFNKPQKIAFYCDHYLDYIIFENVRKHLPDVQIVAKNKKIQHELSQNGIKAVLWPSFPDAVIMTRHAFHKFPCNKIINIGINHGAYHFKKFISAEKYNEFDLFLFTSEYEVKEAHEFGIKCAQSGGYPKLDPLWQDDIERDTYNLRKEIDFDNGKPTLLFSATWDRSGMSAVDQWYDKLSDFTDDFNVMVTLHPFTSNKYSSKIKNTEGIIFIEDPKNYLHLNLADIMIGDTSSILAEFCTLDKPIVTFSVQDSKRLSPEIVHLIQNVSHQVDHYSELKDMINYALENSLEKSNQRQKYNQIMFDQLDGNHSIKAAKKILKVLKKMDAN